MKSKISRRSFLRNIAAAGSGAAALGLLAGCSSSSTAASSGSTAAAEDKYTPGTYSASKTISYSEIGVSMTFDANSITACEITSSGEQDLLTDDKKTAMAKAIVEGQSADVDAVTSCTLVASVGAIQECVADCIAQATGTEVEKPETTEVTGRVPGYCGPGDWLGEAPADPDKYEDAGTYDVVIVGGGHAGVGAAFGAVDEGATVAVIEKQPWGNFVDLDGTGTNMGGWYGEDIGHVNSKLLIERGYGPYDTGAITSEFCKRAAGRVNPEIIKNFVQYSGQMFDRYEEIYDSYEEERKANDCHRAQGCRRRQDRRPVGGRRARRRCRSLRHERYVPVPAVQHPGSLRPAQGQLPHQLRRLPDLALQCPVLRLSGQQHRVHPQVHRQVCAGDPQLCLGL